MSANPPALSPMSAGTALNEQLQVALQPVVEGLQLVQAMMAANIPAIWQAASIVASSSNASSGAKKLKAERDVAIKMRLCAACGYTAENSTFLKCQLTRIKTGSPAVRGAHIFPYARADLMLHMLGCSDVNVTGNMSLLLQPVEGAVDCLDLTFVLRRGKLVARWLNPSKRHLTIIDSCKDEVRPFLEDKLRGRTWASLEGQELQQPGTWKPLMRAFALHTAFAMAAARRQGWLEDSEYLQACEDGDRHSFQSDDTPTASVALWAAAAAAADPPIQQVVGWAPPATSPPIMCRCATPARPRLVREKCRCYWVCSRKRNAKKPVDLQPCDLHELVKSPSPSASDHSDDGTSNHHDVGMGPSEHVEEELKP